MRVAHLERLRRLPRQAVPAVGLFDLAPRPLRAAVGDGAVVDVFDTRGGALQRNLGYDLSVEHLALGDTVDLFYPHAIMGEIAGCDIGDLLGRIESPNFPRFREFFGEKTAIFDRTVLASNGAGDVFQ